MRYQRLLKSTDYTLKYDRAIVYYDKKDFYRALPLFEELLNIYKGTTKAQEIYYYYAYCHYGMGDYLLASYHFKNYTSTFPKGIHAEECQFMNAYCYYRESPVSSLDQEATLKAINEFQLFANLFPQSSRIARCNELIDELRFKLETKSYETGKLYLKTENYKAAIVALNNTLKDFPASKFKDEILYLILKANYFLAINSIDEKKEPRLQDALESYNKCISFSKSQDYIKDIENIHQNIQTELKKTKTSNS
ncbi:MAG: hypothetical protein A3K10_02370 [Bacteroidetes bacterium RIFCSPLOWO2_12_FULL_31_6]|nr:MAG: hypothetical protein A3K10_02370 [Bacteroidetes bacterium RIFCSPLOWO2_12_FULL_31_6]